MLACWWSEMSTCLLHLHVQTSLPGKEVGLWEVYRSQCRKASNMIPILFIFHIFPAWPHFPRYQGAKTKNHEKEQHKEGHKVIAPQCRSVNWAAATHFWIPKKDQPKVHGRKEHKQHIKLPTLRTLWSLWRLRQESWQPSNPLAAAVGASNSCIQPRPIAGDVKTACRLTSPAMTSKCSAEYVHGTVRF